MDINRILGVIAITDPNSAVGFQEMWEAGILTTLAKEVGLHPLIAQMAIDLKQKKLLTTGVEGSGRTDHIRNV